MKIIDQVSNYLEDCCWIKDKIEELEEHLLDNPLDSLFDIEDEDEGID